MRYLYIAENEEIISLYQNKEHASQKPLRIKNFSEHTLILKSFYYMSSIDRKEIA